jgi:hypothetical protein
MRSDLLPPTPTLLLNLSFFLLKKRSSVIWVNTADALAFAIFLFICVMCRECVIFVVLNFIPLKNVKALASAFLIKKERDFTYSVN